MSMTRIFGLAVIASVTLLAGSGERASAVPVCSGEYTSSNGATTIASAPNIGSVQSGCEIGPYFSPTTGVDTNLGAPASVSNSANPSIYEFIWGGGNLTIKEALGNNGIGNNINVELGLSTATLNVIDTLSSTIASTMIPYQSGPTTSGVYVINDMNLAAGTYILDTYLGTCGLARVVRPAPRPIPFTRWDLRL
jgi:hypothetical protein